MAVFGGCTTFPDKPSSMLSWFKSQLFTSDHDCLPLLMLKSRWFTICNGSSIIVHNFVCLKHSMCQRNMFCLDEALMRHDPLCSTSGHTRESLEFLHFAHPTLGVDGFVPKIWGFPSMEVSNNGWFIRENPI